MKSVMISINPKWCELIASGKKTIEVRKTKPKLETPFKVYIYCTKQKVNGEILLTYDKKVEGRNRGFRFEGDIPLAGKVIGEFVCDEIFAVDCDCIAPFNKHTKRYIDEESCLSKEEFVKYTRMRLAYGWHISNLVIYDKPKELSEFQKACNHNEDCCTCKRWDNKTYDCISGISRPPQSWCYVEELD